MKIKINIVILILLSFLNIGAISNDISNTKNSFDILENNIANISEFQENGAKLQYKTNGNIQKESARIKEVLTNNINSNYKEINKNQYEIFNDDFHTNIKLWCENNYTYVEITLVNKNIKYTTADLRNTIRKLENEKTENTQYFFYYEGKQKELDNNYSIYKLANQNHMQKANFLKIKNGYTGTGYLSNGDKINFALISYNTGSHIIIGTPIIFETY